MELQDIKKILVKLPRQSQELFEVFPFLVTLSEEFPKAEIDLITEDGGSQGLHYLPFKFKVFERPVSKQSLIETHHYCANLHDVFNIDLFLDLENSLNSAFMGFNFRAKERVGYEVKWNKYFLTKRFLNPVGQTTEQMTMKLLEAYLGRSFADVRIQKSLEFAAMAEKIEPLFKVVEPPKFILVMLDNFINVSRQIETWKSFFDCFENQKFAIWSKEDEGVISDLFASIDLGKNNLYMHRGADPKEMTYLLSKVNGVIVNNTWAEGLCNYHGVDAFSILESTSHHHPRYDYFKFKPRRLIVSPNAPLKLVTVGEEKEFGSMNEFIDLLHFSFML